MYTIKKDALYVAKPGSKASYTKYIKHAVKYSSEEAAQQNKCGNEYVVNVYNEVEV